MRHLKFGLVFIARLIAACLLPFGLVPAQDLVKGKIVENVVCLADSGQSYALYLPSAFDRGTKRPILFLFDPGARGPIAVEAFRDAAETCGWILVGSNNSSNGPIADSARAARAIWADAIDRLPIDGRRIYASGFSGGSRVASLFPRIIGRMIAGVIGCGAGLSSGVKPGDLKGAAYFGLAGLADFNYGEMKNLDRSFDPSGVPHRILFFEGVHAWPDPALCARAVGWMEVVAMKGGLRPKDEKLLEGFVGRELDEARSFEDAGRVYWAVDRLEAVRSMAGGFHEIPDLAVRIQALKARKEYGQFLKDEKKRDRETSDFRLAIGRTFGMIERNEAGGEAVRQALRDMGISFLKKKAKAGKTVEDRSLASRLLADLSSAAQDRAGALIEKGGLAEAAAYLDLAIAACEEGLFRQKYVYFNRAVVAVLAGDKKGALEFLSEAVDKGLTDIDLLENVKALDPVRDTDRFREIVEKARNAGQSEKR